MGLYKKSYQGLYELEEFTVQLKKIYLKLKTKKKIGKNKYLQEEFTKRTGFCI